MVRRVAGKPRNSSRDVVWVGESRIQVLHTKEKGNIYKGDSRLRRESPWCGQ